MTEEYLEAETEHMADRATVDSSRILDAVDETRKGLEDCGAADSRQAIDNTSAAAYACPTCGQITAGEVRTRMCEPHGRFPCRDCGTVHFEGCQCVFCRVEQGQNK